jgi:DeoR family transcriptional regulator, fructose operon transcriptional repressor
MNKEQSATLLRRQEELLQLVEVKGQITVTELARHFAVSNDTIRRDLLDLESRKLLLRTHGGAVSTALLVHRETTFQTRTTSNAEAKARIGRAAAQLIADGETLIINGGSTTFAFASNLASRRDLTIVTNNVPMLSLISPEAVRDVLVVGGTYRLDLASTVGWVGFKSGNISVDTAVLGVSGISVKSGISTTFFEEASMLAQMIDCARRTIVLADGSKFGVGAFAQIAPLEAIDIFVTEAALPADLSDALSQAGVEIVMASV